jgi:hypothetical protein
MRLGCFARSSLLFALLLVPACDPPPPATGDAGADAQVADAGPACVSDPDCDDGLFCNGAEHCTAGLCAAGAAVRCDDGIACTIDACSEDMRACLSAPPDVDRDGAGDALCLDAAGAPLGTDCADDDANRFPDNTEVCDAAMHDEDCADATHGSSDVDGDGFEDARCCNGSACGDDCNDTRADVHPGASEVCNLVDDDCNAVIDEGVSVSGFFDADRDGYGDGARPTTACGTASDFSPYGTDCADDDVARNPGQAEFCDLVDNDCDTRVDESASNVDWYPDGDGDGFGSAISAPVSSCAPLPMHSLLATDCDDAHAVVSPAAAETCDAIDDDCNGLADFVVAPGNLEDDDGDGVADSACGAPRGLDCDDLDAASAPAAAESCDGRDNDCDARVDEGATSVAFFRDADGDGFGTDASLIVACTQPTGYARRGGDCDDASIAIRPGSIEACDAIDEDCDGAVDEAEASSMCTLANATSICVGGRCQIGVCDPGFADCASAPGCESDVLSDAAHCGSCTACTEVGSLCAAGACRPTLASLLPIGTSTTSDEIVNDVAPVPGSNDVIVVGAFRGTLTFGGTSVTSLGGLDGFAARVRPDGTAMWSARWGGVLDDEMSSIAIEPVSGALVLGGNLCGPQTLCAGPIGSGTICLGFWQRFMSTAAPTCNYAAVFDGTGGTTVRSLAIERVGPTTYVYAGGAVSGTSAVLGLSSVGDYDGFIARFHEAGGAVRDWVRTQASIYVDETTDVALDGAGHILGVGTSGGSVDFGSGAQGFSGYSDPYVVSYQSATGVLAAGREFGAGGASYDNARSLVVTGGQAYVAGAFGETFGPTTLFAGVGVSIPSNGQRDAYLVRFDAATLAPVWAVSIGGALDDDARSTALVGGNVVVTGSFRDTMPIGAGSFSSWAGTDGFAVAIAPSGTLAWARQASGFGDEVSTGVATLSDGRVAWITNFGSNLQILGTPLAGDAGTGVANAYLAF